MEELQLAPHHLINIKDPTESYSAAQFCNDAGQLCQSILKRSKIPLLVGGTMMYFNALQKGLSVLPEANDHVRQRIESEASAYGWAHLHQKLTEVDPSTSQRIHVHDTQRIQRALEVYYITGIPMSTFLVEEKKNVEYRFVNVALFPQERAWLHERIALRFEQMLAAGFIQEVEHLKEQWDLNASLPAMRCVGYRQILDYLQGSYDLTKLRDKGIAATRQLAKRQLTWLRHWSNILVYDPQATAFNDKIVAKIREILDNEVSSF
jgi:tRNA dimethylallyltransferase